MTILTDYNAFAGRHWETGSVHNYYAYRNVCAPHTGKPISEALLLGVSGGIVFGYFSFAYEGYDPYVAILTRNTFDPLDTMLSRLGVMQNVRQTTSPAKGTSNLVATLEEGIPAIVWADYFSLPYNAPEQDEMMWGMFPVVVYGLDETTAYLADRAGVGLTVSAETLLKSRTRVKKSKNRIATLEAPDFAKLPAAVTAGIWDTINLFTEKPPKGSRNNFGLQAYQHWIKLLTKPKQRKSWAKVFPSGRNLYCALTSTYERVAAFGQAKGGAEREQYADFLDEAALILDKPQLNAVAQLCRHSATLWHQLGAILLPDAVAGLGESRQLIDKRRDLFTEKGGDALDQIVATKEQLAEIKAGVSADFPLTQPQVDQLQQTIADHVQQIHDSERDMMTALKAAMS